MPILSRLSRSSMPARRAPGGGPVGALVVAAAIVAAGCAAPRPGPLASGRATSSPPLPATTAGVPDPESADPPSAASPTPPPPRTDATDPQLDPTPLPHLEPSSASLARYTVVCEDGGSPPPTPGPACGDAVALALAAVGDGPAASIERLDFWFGDGCDRSVPCPERRADVGWVIARAAPSETLAVRVALDPAGALLAWPPVPGPGVVRQAFRPPIGSTPDLGVGLPGGLRDRAPVPSCGSEDLTSPDAFATHARTCFLDGVLAGAPVELLSRSASTEGRLLLTLYRFTGRGAVLRYVRSDAGWTGSACGISPIRTPAVFLLAGTCERVEP